MTQNITTPTVGPAESCTHAILARLSQTASCSIWFCLDESEEKKDQNSKRPPFFYQLLSIDSIWQQHAPSKIREALNGSLILPLITLITDYAKPFCHFSPYSGFSPKPGFLPITCLLLVTKLETGSRLAIGSLRNTHVENLVDETWGAVGEAQAPRIIQSDSNGVVINGSIDRDISISSLDKTHSTILAGIRFITVETNLRPFVQLSQTQEVEAYNWFFTTQSPIATTLSFSERSTANPEPDLLA